MNAELRLLEQLERLARSAGREIMDVYGRANFSVERKGDGSPLTEADRRAHRCIIDGLAKVSPGIPAISEEGELPAYAVRKDWDRFWLVDPLDGTKEFLKRNGEFTVNIALIENRIPVAGVVYAPAINLLFKARRDTGCVRVANGKSERLKSAKPSFDRPLVVAESRSHPSPELERFLSGLKVERRVAVGSSLKFGLLAEGKADLYPRLGPTMEWDCAAGDCVYRYSAAEGVHDTGLRYNTETLLFERFVAGLPELLASFTP